MSKLDSMYEGIKAMVAKLRESNESFDGPHTVTEEDYETLELKEMQLLLKHALGARRPRRG